MFKVHCHVHESAVLLDWSRIEALYNTDEGPVIDWHCWCGARGRLVAGSRSEPRTFEPVVLDLGRQALSEDVSTGATGRQAGSGEGPTVDAGAT